MLYTNKLEYLISNRLKGNNIFKENNIINFNYFKQKHCFAEEKIMSKYIHWIKEKQEIFLYF